MRTKEFKHRQNYQLWLKNPRNNTQIPINVYGNWVEWTIEFAEANGLIVLYGTRRLTIEQAEMITILNREEQ